MSKILIVRNCYQCRYGEYETKEYDAWCYENDKRLENFPIMPKWCPLPDREEDDEKRN